eukprot:g5709.t1
MQVHIMRVDLLAQDVLINPLNYCLEQLFLFGQAHLGGALLPAWLACFAVSCALWSPVLLVVWLRYGLSAPRHKASVAGKPEQISPVAGKPQQTAPRAAQREQIAPLAAKTAPSSATGHPQPAYAPAGRWSGRCGQLLSCHWRPVFSRRCCHRHARVRRLLVREKTPPSPGGQEHYKWMECSSECCMQDFHAALLQRLRPHQPAEWQVESILIDSDGHSVLLESDQDLSFLKEGAALQVRLLPRVPSRTIAPTGSSQPTNQLTKQQASNNDDNDNRNDNDNNNKSNNSSSNSNKKNNNKNSNKNSSNKNVNHNGQSSTSHPERPNTQPAPFQPSRPETNTSTLENDHKRESFCPSI